MNEAFEDFRRGLFGQVVARLAQSNPATFLGQHEASSLRLLMDYAERSLKLLIHRRFRFEAGKNTDVNILAADSLMAMNR